MSVSFPTSHLSELYYSAALYTTTHKVAPKVQYLVNDVLCGAVACGLNDSARLLWGDVMDMDKEWVVVHSCATYILGSFCHGACLR